MVGLSLYNVTLVCYIVLNAMSDSSWRVIGIDVGYSNLAMVVCDVDREDFEITPVYAKMTDLRHIMCRDKDCMFEHNDRKAGHLVYHFVENMSEWFSSADQILIEAQPICSSHKDVEQLLLVYIKQRYSVPQKKPRDHVKLLHPQTMHSHFSMSSEKVERRIEIVDITRNYIEELAAFKKAEQRDHLGDAMGYVLLYVQTLMPQVMWSMKPNRFEKFKFVPDIKS